MPDKLFQLPDLKPKVTLQKREASLPDVSLLKRKQLDVFKGIINCIVGNGGGLIVLKGVAGTGKSFLVARIIEQYLSEFYDRRIAFSATTNKAVKVAYRLTEFYHPCLDFSTIHRLLGLKEVILKDGTTDFQPDKNIRPSIEEYRVVFIDESSMLNKKLFNYLLPYMDRVYIIFVGDPCQIVPVKEIETPVFNIRIQRDYNMLVFELDEIVRQAADNPIIEVATSIRENIGNNFSAAYNYNFQSKYIKGTDKGVEFLRHSKDADRLYFDSLLQHIFTSENFKHSADFGKILAYTNKAVNALNKSIRRMIYGPGKLRRIEPGEKLVTKAPIFNDALDMIVVNNAEELIVGEFERKIESINGGDFEIPYYSTEATFYDIKGTERKELIKIPTDIGVKSLNKLLELLAEVAKSYKPGTYQAYSAWQDFYAIKKSFAEINYNYALTFHLSQGSTFDNVVVLEFNARICNRLTERNKLIYTGCTRPSERLFIVS